MFKISDKSTESIGRIVQGVALAIWSIFGGFGVYYLTNSLILSFCIAGLVMAYYMYTVAYAEVKKSFEKYDRTALEAEIRDKIYAELLTGEITKVPAETEKEEKIEKL